MVIHYSQLSPRKLENGELVDENGLPLEKALALDITKSINDSHLEELTEAWVMAFVQRSWRISESESRNVNLIFATYKTNKDERLILGVFRFGRGGKDCFVDSPYKSEGHCEDPGRRIFLAEPAEDSLRKRYIGNYLPQDTPGSRNPIRYY